MKNLKRTLCLLLAMVMVLSMGVVSASAAYVDEEDIANKEAVTVLSSLKVLEGYQDTFRPNDGLTRAEGCTIITKLLGQENFTGKSNFADMNDAAWADSAVAYCKAAGIVHGVGSNKFAPNEPLTGNAFAKMLLCALGYQAEAEGITGSSWEAGVARLIQKIGLSKGLTAFNGTQAISREDAAQLAFNTLKATMVEYENGMNIENGDLNITVSGVRGNVAAIGKDYAGDDANTTCQFCEYYFRDLKLRATGEQAYGRPGYREWVLDDESIYTVSKDSTLMERYWDTVSTATLYKLIGKDTYNELRSGTKTLTVYVDGVEEDASCTSYFAKNGTEDAANTGNGVLTEIYKDENGNLVIVQIHTYLAAAVEDYDRSRDELDVEIFGHADLDTLTLSADDFDVAGCKEGDYLVLNFDGGVLYSVDEAEVIKGEVTGYTVGESVSVDGKKYGYSQTFDATAFPQTDFTIDAEIMLVMDPFGNILGLETVEAVQQYLYVVEVAQSGYLSRSGFVAAAIFPDGTYRELSVKSIDGRKPTTDDFGWFTCKLTGSDTYSLTSPENAVTAEGPDFEIVRSSVKFLYDDTNDVYAENVRATAGTVFIVVDAQGEYRVYNGYNKLPSINSDNANSILVQAVNNDYGYTMFVCVFTGAAVVEEGQPETTDTVFISNEDYSVSVDRNGVTFYSYEGYFNGTFGTIQINGMLPGVGLYDNIRLDESGYLDAAAIVPVTETGESFTVQTVTDAALTTSSNIMGIDGNYYVLAKDCAIHVIGDNGTTTTYSVSRFVSRLNGALCGIVYGVYENGELTTLYVDGRTPATP